MIDSEGRKLINSVWLPKIDRNHRWIMQPIPKGKEIIGVYGNNDSRKSSLIKQLIMRASVIIKHIVVIAQ